MTNAVCVLLLDVNLCEMVVVIGTLSTLRHISRGRKTKSLVFTRASCVNQRKKDAKRREISSE